MAHGGHHRLLTGRRPVDQVYQRPPFDGAKLCPNAALPPTSVRVSKFFAPQQVEKGVELLASDAQFPPRLADVTKLLAPLGNEFVLFVYGLFLLVMSPRTSRGRVYFAQKCGVLLKVKSNLFPRLSPRRLLRQLVPLTSALYSLAEVRVALPHRLTEQKLTPLIHEKYLNTSTIRVAVLTANNDHFVLPLGELSLFVCALCGLNIFRCHVAVAIPFFPLRDTVNVCRSCRMRCRSYRLRSPPFSALMTVIGL
ncbi:NUDIX hydrolase dihydroneopterin triphosphate pyrophosphohydrolase/hydrolase, putative [Leishmania tarentolae]|uniref:NUDIX hydrolase dihydroneopterin triphosphate pyrophosphohydrolase/hydrolase, putative n=1 Tax=Leishmania tarentolae TaxID=5689 RepID=A0A640KQC9_LEITA|nr:NUDIX hydrolase dihydroneopterin triphosphate pyrophosphohydrolase/hydrolase, putative [Leishmania tarentolae]